ncbi:cytochrome-c domain-containing protein (plasmid) [Rhizobium gallicum bv. gallicum R602sp]|uniref:Cytochrome-c domain-containing protein n=1 Tax=Rhizobium gallicum bv. gallicum R602sp TaxID=1041138 RepID=A0A0B4XGC3_9HYPH|nr:cytochrome-c domain-containing protein [Rhizobium gallicum bv. gallicum R602sp]
MEIGCRASRSTATGLRRCGPFWSTERSHKGGFYHDGRFATLEDAVRHYDRHLDVTDEERSDLIEYLKSI